MRRKQEKIGLVISDKMEKTVVVKVETSRPHKLYEKRISKSRKFAAHNLVGAKAGDVVRILSSRPISRRKRWIVKEVLKHAAA